MIVKLNWPNKILSSNARGASKSAALAKAVMTRWHRQAAFVEVKSRLRRNGPLDLPARGDIPITIIFSAPSFRFDRQNMPGLCKSYVDGIADALGVNDRRFLPHYVYAKPTPPWGSVTIEITSAEARAA